MVSGDFGDGSSQTTPLFWVKYEEAAPLSGQALAHEQQSQQRRRNLGRRFLQHQPLRGPIYQTKNLQDRTLAQIAPSDSARTKVREQIEAEIRTFQRNVWMGDSVRSKNTADTSKVEAQTASSARSLRAR